MGYMSTCSVILGPPISRAIWQMEAAIFPPALSPATGTREAFPPNSDALSCAHLVAA